MDDGLEFTLSARGGQWRGKNSLLLTIGSLPLSGHRFTRVAART